jgi:hypothetical protein
MKIVVWNGRSYWAVPPRRLEPWTAVTCRRDARVAVASAAPEPARSVAPSRSPLRPPRYAPRPRARARRSRLRHGGSSERGPPDDGDGGGSDPPGPALASDIAARAP